MKLWRAWTILDNIGLGMWFSRKSASHRVSHCGVRCFSLEVVRRTRKRTRSGAISCIYGGTLALVLGGCAADPGRVIMSAHHELEPSELAYVCNHGERDSEPGLEGCFQWVGGVCHLYTLPRVFFETRDGNLNDFHDTLGHELDHCERGLFHGRGVPSLPRLPSLKGF